MLKNVYVDVENSGEYVKFAALAPEGEIHLLWDGGEFYNYCRCRIPDAKYAHEVNSLLAEYGVPETWQGHSRRVKAPRDPSVGLVPTDWNE